MDVLEAGSLINARYVVVRCLRSGGMGAVYACLDRTTGRQRAVKVLLPELVDGPEHRARFLREATVTAEVQSEHIVEAFDVGVDPTTRAPYLVTELLRGEDLGGVLADRGELTAEETVALLGHLALAVERMHEVGVVHRDLKPENLFVTAADDGSAKLKVLDFGIAKIVKPGDDGRDVTTMGTPMYMSPEQMLGEPVGPSADLFAIGHIAYALLAGEAYWAEEADETPTTLALFARLVTGATEPASERAKRRRGVEIAPAFDAWFERATATVTERFERPDEMVEELAAALGVATDARVEASALVPHLGFGRRSSAPPARVSEAPAVSVTPVSATRAPRRAWSPAAAVMTAALVLGAGAWVSSASRVAAIREPAASIPAAVGASVPRAAAAPPPPARSVASAAPAPALPAPAKPRPAARKVAPAIADPDASLDPYDGPQAPAPDVAGWDDDPDPPRPAPTRFEPTSI